MPSGEARSELALLTRLQQATAALAGALTVGEAVQIVTEAGVETLAADAAGVGLLTEGRLEWLPPSLSSGPVGTVEQPATTLELPLFDAEGVIGSLRYVFDEPRLLSDAEHAFAEALAGQCALAVARARLIMRERAAALTLQRALLPPRLPLVPHVELAGRYLPAVRDMSVGGDWYDALVLPDGRLSLSVGDVMGKGLVAAAGMGRMRSALRALAVNDPDPAGVLASLDRLFVATESGDHELLLTTLVVLVVDPMTGAVSAADAGHLPIVRVRADGVAELLDVGPGTTPLGLPEPRTTINLVLSPGEALLAFTDGLVEERDRSLDEGLAAVIAAASSCPGSSLEELLDVVLSARGVTYGGADDVTVLGVRMREHGRDEWR
ncbi:MAG TPA: PP2C family protein-serine/threonine phosphatase [Candidatus Limnocylindria bacterium]|nr:PP2C family protein-serine/threonine phosphatase [Candidatus Limnocylindria bacterium]